MSLFIRREGLMNSIQKRYDQTTSFNPLYIYLVTCKYVNSNVLFLFYLDNKSIELMEKKKKKFYSLN